MKILHYSLGCPPYRRGGLTKYCLDLMAMQMKQNNIVAMCWPGEIGVFKHQDVSIKKHTNCNVENFEIKGLHPVPLLEGVSRPVLFMEKKPTDDWERFLNMWKPDVIHFHTMMGLPIEFVKKANVLGIRTVYTTHDYYGICPRTTLQCQNGDARMCASCCEGAPGYIKLAILQSDIYRILKESYIVKMLRKKHWDHTKNIVMKDGDNRLVEFNDEYVRLRKYYIDLLTSFNTIHFNSNNTKDTYLGIVGTFLNYKVVPITHSMIKDNKREKKIHDLISFSYLGPDTYGKGYFLLKSVMKQLHDEGYRFVLNVYFKESSEPFIISHSPYQYSDLSKVMGDADCVILPSIWNETFGFTALEAISYGVPVIVSKKVGAKDYVKNGQSGFIVDENNEDLKNCISNLLNNPTVLSDMNAFILKNTHIKTMNEHGKEIENMYRY